MSCKNPSTLLYQMDFLSMHMGAIFTLFLFLSFLYKSLWRKNPQKHSINLTASPPHPSGAWPIIGHLHLLIRSQNHIAQTLGTLADKYGPIFTLRLGLKRAVVVSSREAIMECFTTNDESLASRPKSSAGEHLIYHDLTNNICWHEIMRKLVSLHVTMNLQAAEISTMNRLLYLESKAVRPSRVMISNWIEDMVLNIIVKTIVGKRYGDESRFREIVREICYLSSQFVISDVIPIPLLRWMDVGGHIKSMKGVSKELDGILKILIDENDRRRVGGEARVENDSLIDVMLSIIDDKFPNCCSSSRVAIVKIIVVNVILGGFNTTSTFLTRTLSVLIITNNQVMKHAKEEIESQIGKQRWVQESDLDHLPYLQAILQETLRLYPPLPLSIPREAVKDCHIDGYFILEGTQLFVNLWKLHRDPRAWPEPERFLPERFLTSHDVNLRKQFEFVPFGYGNRSCPGINFAMQFAKFTLARLIQGFDFAAPVDVNCSSEGGEEYPLEEVLIAPRLPSHLYEE